MTDSPKMDFANGTPMMVGPWMMGLADPTPETVEYWDGVAVDKFLLKQCESCHAHQHPRRLFCTKCQHDRFAWVQACGRGTIYTFSTVYRGPTETFQKDTPYTVALIELDEGVFFCSRMIASPESIEIGQAVEVYFDDVAESGRLPIFRPSNH